MREESLSLVPAKRDIQQYSNQIDVLVDIADGHVVENDESAKMAVELVSQVKKLFGNIESARKHHVAAPNDYVKAVNSFAKTFTERLMNIERTLKAKIGSYTYQIEIRRREAEQLAREEAKKLQEKINQQAEEKGIEPVQVQEPVMPKTKESIRSDSGSAHIRHKWKGEIVDPALLPFPEYWEPSQKKVDEAIKAGIREIPGVRIWEDIETVVR